MSNLRCSRSADPFNEALFNFGCLIFLSLFDELASESTAQDLDGRSAKLAVGLSIHRGVNCVTHLVSSLRELGSESTAFRGHVAI